MATAPAVCKGGPPVKMLPVYGARWSDHENSLAEDFGRCRKLQREDEDVTELLPFDGVAWVSNAQLLQW